MYNYKRFIHGYIVQGIKLNVKFYKIILNVYEE